MPRVQMTPGNIVFSTSAVLNFHWARLLMGDRRLDMVGWSLLKVELHFIHRIRCSEMVPQIKPHFFNRKNTALFLYPIVNVKKGNLVQWWPCSHQTRSHRTAVLFRCCRASWCRSNQSAQIGSDVKKGSPAWIPGEYLSATSMTCEECLRDDLYGGLIHFN